jgi:hypothetical protein
MIIGICGAPGVGKGEAAKILIDRGFTNGKFSHALKDMFRALLAYRGAIDIDRYVEGDLKELPTPLLNGKSPRHAMQTLGAWGRNDIDEELWVDAEFDAQDSNADLVFDDVRAASEEAAIRNRGGAIIHLKGRDGIESEHYLEKFVPKVATVIDNIGTLEELWDKVNEFCSDLSWAA